MEIRFIDAELITKTVANLCIEANLVLNESIRRALVEAREVDTSKLAQHTLDMILENAEVAKREKLPMCQDTGMAVVFVTIGSKIHVVGNISEAINEGVRIGYREGYFRNSIVSDPISRINTKDNTPAVIYYDFDIGDKIKITVAPKGFGSENMSGVSMLNPSDGIEGVMEFILNTVRAAGSKPCPPIIVGVGVGGTMDKAALMAKQALVRDIGSANSDTYWADIEVRLLEQINEIGIGPAGYGGRTTALAVHIVTYPTHIAGLPVAVNIGCHATRHNTAIL